MRVSSQIKYSLWQSIKTTTTTTTPPKKKKKKKDFLENRFSSSLQAESFRVSLIVCRWCLLSDRIVNSNCVIIRIANGMAIDNSPCIKNEILAYYSHYKILYIIQLHNAIHSVLPFKSKTCLTREYLTHRFLFYRVSQFV